MQDLSRIKAMAALRPASVTTRNSATVPNTIATAIEVG